MNKTTELVFILDRSGSMAGLEADTMGGFNAMLEKQKKQEGDCFVTTVLFDHELLTLHDRLPLQQVRPMTGEDYQVRGCTALLDAIGETVRHIEGIHKYARREDVPDQTIFVITTDGMENASKRYTQKTVKELVEKKKEAGWEFLFLGANIDAVSTAGGFGIGKDRAVTFTNDSEGVRLNYEVLGDAICAARACQPLAADWKSRIEEDHKGRSRAKKNLKKD